MTFAELALDELKDPVALLMNSFFTPARAAKLRAKNISSG